MILVLNTIKIRREIFGQLSIRPSSMVACIAFFTYRLISFVIFPSLSFLIFYERFLRIFFLLNIDMALPRRYASQIIYVLDSDSIFLFGNFNLVTDKVAKIDKASIVRPIEIELPKKMKNKPTNFINVKEVAVSAVFDLTNFFKELVSSLPCHISLLIKFRRFSG